MNVDTIDKLKKLKPTLKEKFGLEEFGVFGSQARNDFKGESDIDLVIIKIKEKDFFIRMNIKKFLEQELGKKVDIGYFDSLRNVIKEEIKKDIIYV